jgi:peptide chain release factor 2
VAPTDFDTEIKQLQATMVTIGKVLDLDAIRTEIAGLSEEVSDPNLWDDQANAQRVTGRLSLLQGELDRFATLSTRLEDVELMVEMATEEGDEATLAETDHELDRVHKAVEALEVRTLLSGEYDAREAIILTRSHVVAEFFHIDWTSRARRKLGVPVLHLLEHENFDEQAGEGEGISGF